MNLQLYHYVSMIFKLNQLLFYFISLKFCFLSISFGTLLVSSYKNICLWRKRNEKLGCFIQKTIF